MPSGHCTSETERADAGDQRGGRGVGEGLGIMAGDHDPWRAAMQCTPQTDRFAQLGANAPEDHHMYHLEGSLSESKQTA